MLWSTDSRTIIHVQAKTACGHCENCFDVTVDIESCCCVFLKFDVIVSSIKSFYLIQEHVK